MRIIHSMGHVVGGALLIAGTTIGVGMLAMPVATGAGGFVPSMLIYFACWAFMLCTGLLLVEANLWMPKDTSFISMADKLLGPWGRRVFWAFYLFLFTTVMIAHSVGGGAVFLDITGLEIPHFLAVILYCAVFAPVVYLGAHSVDRLNMVLISGVVLCYAAFLAVALPHVDMQNLTHANWSKAWLSLPILFTAFTYQVIIPTLMTYMERNVKKVRLAIIFGSSIPLVIYLIWEFTILGTIPTHELIRAAEHGHTAVEPLKTLIPEVFSIGKYFAFFALTTSYIPLALSFFDFVRDGLKWKRDGYHRFVLTLVIFGIPALIGIVKPDIFLKALGFAGGISCAFLFGLMPPVLVWIGRYKKKLPRHPQLPGGKAMLGTLIAIAITILIAEWV